MTVPSFQIHTPRVIAGCGKSWYILTKDYVNKTTTITAFETNGKQWFLLRVLSVETPTWSFQLHSHLNISEWISFGKGFNMLNANVLLFQQNDQWQDGTIQITSSSLCKNPGTKPKSTPIYAHLHNTLSQCWGMDGPCSQKHFTWGHPENCSKTSVTYIYPYLSRSKKNPISFYCIICHVIFLLHIVSTFPTKHCKCCHNSLAVVSNMQRMPKISPLFPAAKAGQVEMHFAQIFKPWQPCCFRTEITVHPLTEHDNICHEFEVQIRKAKPEIMPLRVVDLRNIDYGWLLYEEICSAYLLLGQSYILPTSGCNVSHSRKTFQILWKKKSPEFSKVASKFYKCVDAMKGHKGKNLRTAVTPLRPTGFQSGTVCGRV